MSSRLVVALLFLCLPAGARSLRADGPLRPHAFVHIQGSGSGYGRDGQPDPDLADFDRKQSEGAALRLEQVVTSWENAVDTMIAEAHAGVDSSPAAPVQLHTYARSSSATGPGTARGLARWTDYLVLKKSGVQRSALPTNLNLHWAVSGKLSFLYPGAGTAGFYVDFQANGVRHPRSYIAYQPTDTPSPLDFRWRWAGPALSMDPYTGTVKGELIEKVPLVWEVEGDAIARKPGRADVTYVARVSYRLTFVSYATSRGGWTNSDFDHTMALGAISFDDGVLPAKAGYHAAAASGVPLAPRAGGSGGSPSGSASGGGGGSATPTASTSNPSAGPSSSLSPGPPGPGPQIPPGGGTPSPGPNPPPVSTTPEPGGLALLSAGAALLALAWRRRRSRGPLASNNSPRRTV